ncbi:serine arginine repetitive matrix 1 [Trichoderma cornu-damae]|uniref:Serine arginine repetitive matrix 1 n=1 Tax=Trichoderma cornu-damae TaxID=654480 RepID=A0A9P8QH22_9HYPO|nr:serine arginine repetitive matrix 1 [Trichoderma cornu-damae]
MPPHYTKSATSSRFELLPALNLNFGSITDGTDIPPPPESPIESTYTPSKTPKGSHDSIECKEGTSTASEIKAGTRSFTEDAPSSPAVSGQQESAVQESGRSFANAYRPDSRSGSSVVDSEKKRTSGWFKRLRSGEYQSKRRSSLLSLEQPHLPTTSKLNSDKQPPKIPKLVHLESDKGNLGSNLFDHIK